MDVSKTYIKMCEKAEEIQAQKPNVGNNEHDYFYCQKHQDLLGQYFDMGVMCEIRCNENYTWLPRQDQLQEMVTSDNVESFWSVAIPFYEYWLEQNISPDCPILGSMEQLWLAFVMKTLYSKVWNDSEWVASG